MFEQEMADALKRRETLRDSYNQNEGVLSFLEYWGQKEKTMLSRDFVTAFMTGQVKAGVTPDDARKNFIAWLMDPTNSVVETAEKERIVSDLDSYSIKG